MPSWISRGGRAFGTWPNPERGSHVVVPKQHVFDVEKLGLVERVDQIGPNCRRAVPPSLTLFDTAKSHW